jgi:hypothetical protein
MIIRKPLCEQPDQVVEKIRAFRHKAKDLKIYRAKGYCEICNQPFGTRNPKLEGHHIISPSVYKGKDPNEDSNIVICCDYCYINHVLRNDQKWREETRTYNRTADERLREIEYNKNRTKGIGTIPPKKFVGIHFNYRVWHIRIGIGIYKRKKRKEKQFENIETAE